MNAYAHDFSITVREGYKVLWLHASEHGRPIYESLGFLATNEMKLIIE